MIRGILLTLNPFGFMEIKSERNMLLQTATKDESYLTFANVMFPSHKSFDNQFRCFIVDKSI